MLLLCGLQNYTKSLLDFTADDISLAAHHHLLLHILFEFLAFADPKVLGTLHASPLWDIRPKAYGTTCFYHFGT